MYYLKVITCILLSGVLTLLKNCITELEGGAAVSMPTTPPPRLARSLVREVTDRQIDASDLCPVLWDRK